MIITQSCDYSNPTIAFIASDSADESYRLNIFGTIENDTKHQTSHVVYPFQFQAHTCQYNVSDTLVSVIAFGIGTIIFLMMLSMTYRFMKSK